MSLRKQPKADNTASDEPLKSSPVAAEKAHRLSLIPTLLQTALVWPLIAALPIYLTYNDNYKKVFEGFCFDETERTFHFQDIYKNVTWAKAGGYLEGPNGCSSEFPLPLGLTLGLLAVVVGQFFVLIYFYQRKTHHLGSTVDIQVEGARKYEFQEGLLTHLAQPEGFVLLGAYLAGTWLFGLMPKSYYSFQGGINWTHVFLQLLCQDFIQSIMHLLEHKLHPKLYQNSHKPHHRFTNPRLFDAFNGSLSDTICMILIPLYCTANVVPANVWSYMAFGSLYANWLTLIHSEFSHPWDYIFRKIGFGTAADHHVHHKLFVYNYGHIFMYWDRLFGTYRSPTDPTVFNSEI